MLKFCRTSEEIYSNIDRTRINFQSPFGCVSRYYTPIQRVSDMTERRDLHWLALPGQPTVLFYYNSVKWLYSFHCFKQVEFFDNIAAR